MSSALSAVVIAIGSIAATLVGAAAGIVGTLYVHDAQARAATAAEVRSQRDAAYRVVNPAADRLLMAELEILRGEKYCSLRVELQNGRSPCLSYKSSDTLDAAYDRWVEVSQNVELFGSAAAIESFRLLDEDVRPASFAAGLLGGSRAMDIHSLEEEEQDDSDQQVAASIKEYNALNDAFRRVMCKELLADPAACLSAI